MNIFSRHHLPTKALAIIMSLILLTTTVFAFDREVSSRWILDTFNKVIALEPLPGPYQMMVPVVLSVAEPLFLYGGDGSVVGAEMSFREIKSYQLKITLSNSGEKPFSHPSHPSLKRYSDGAWLPCPVKDGEIAEVALPYSLGPGQSKEFTYDLSFYYGELSPGDYQAEMLIKQYEPPYGTPLKSYSLTCRFSIVDEV